jgi:opacity protein-like surface antigen
MAKTFSTLFVLWAFAGAAAAEWPIGGGIKIGGSLNDVYHAAVGSAPNSSGIFGYISSANNIVVGPMVELRLPAKFSVEVDALYRGAGFRRSLALTGGITSNPINLSPSNLSFNADASAWEFPVLLKYRFSGIGVVKPYAGAGLAFKHINASEIAELTHKNSAGVVLAGGLEFKLLLLRISPEIRYSGYTVSSFESAGGLLKANRNQFAFLVGFSF